MADIKVKISIKYIDRYDGKFAKLLKAHLMLPSFEYDKTVKTDDTHVTAKEIEKDFEKAAHGIFGTISYITDEVLKENKLSKPPVAPSDIKTVQAQLNKELAPFKKTLTKLLDDTIDEMCGIEKPEAGFDPKDDRLTAKYLAAVKEAGAIEDALASLGASFRASANTASLIVSDRVGTANPADKAREWAKMLAKVEDSQAGFLAVAKDVQRALKTKAPSIAVPKAAAKETKEQKETREELTRLAKALAEMPDCIDEINTLITETASLAATLVTALRAGPEGFKMSKWPEVPDGSAAWKKLEKQLDAASKAWKELN